jgi:hypothetical protein
MPGTELSVRSSILFRQPLERITYLRKEKAMPNDPYLDASVAWLIRSGNIDFHESGYHQTVQSILENGLAMEVRGMVSSGKEATYIWPNSTARRWRSRCTVYTKRRTRAVGR